MSARLAAEILRRRITVFHSAPSTFRSPLGGARAARSRRPGRPPAGGDRASSADVALHRDHFPAGSVLANGLGTTETGLFRQFRIAAGD